MREYGTAKAKELKRPKSHIRQDFGSRDEQIALAQDYLRRPIHPIITSMDLVIGDGNRRHAGVMLVNPEADIPICKTDELVDEKTLIEIMLQSAIHTKSLTPYEEFVGYSKRLELEPGLTAEKLAELVGRKPPMLSRILSLRKAIPPIREAAQAGIIGVAEWSEFAKCAPEEQHQLWQARAAGQFQNRDDVASASRRVRTRSRPDAVKAARVSIAMPSASVVITGGDLSMSSVIQLLGDVLKEAKKAAEQYDVKTFQSMMRDKAKVTS